MRSRRECARPRRRSSSCRWRTSPTTSPSSARWSRAPRPAPTSSAPAVTCEGGRQLGGPWFKAFLSRAAGVTLHHLSGLPTHDPTNSFKAYRRDFLQRHADREPRGIRAGARVDRQGALSRRPRRGGARHLERAHQGREPVSSVLLDAALPALVLLGAREARPGDVAPRMTAASAENPPGRPGAAARERLVRVGGLVFGARDFRGLDPAADASGGSVAGRSDLGVDRHGAERVASFSRGIASPTTIRRSSTFSWPATRGSRFRRDSAQGLRPVAGPARRGRSDGARLGARRSPGGGSDRCIRRQQSLADRDVHGDPRVLPLRVPGHDLSVRDLPHPRRRFLPPGARDSSF